MRLFGTLLGILNIFLIWTIVFTEIKIKSIPDPAVQSKLIDKLVLYHSIGATGIALLFGVVIILNKEEDH